MPEIHFEQPSQEEKPLPMFRKDLKIYQGPADPDGSPTYNIFDPVRGQYFRINWAESLVFKLLRPGMKMSELIQTIEANSTLKVKSEDLLQFFQDAVVNNLLDVRRSSDAIEGEATKAKSGVFMWLVMHYLYIRIPLINPDKFLNRTLHYVLPLFSTPALCLYGVLILAGFIQLISRFDEFLHTFPYFFSISGAITYGLGITVVKIIHEFAHAYTAKYYKIFVPTMGIALIVFWPVLYTDVTDSWKLAKRPQRLAISVAGIIAELIVAGISTLGWALSPPGMLQSIFFVISSVTWISTLVVNLNPALRFDGYYLLSDLWGIDNLQARAFATTRWQLRKWFLGLDIAPPEENQSFQRRLGMVVYSIYTWIYRLFLYTAIAIFVYFQFTKLLGIFLFFVEIGIFMLWPLWSEIEQLIKLRPYLTMNKRSITTSIVLLLLLGWLILPFPHRQSFSAMTVPDQEQSQVVYVPYYGIVKEIFVKREDYVKKDQPLVVLSSPQLLTDLAESRVEKAIAEKEMLVAAQTEEDRARLSEKQSTIDAVSEKIKGYENLVHQLTLYATVNGTIYYWNENIDINQAVAKDEVIGRIANMDAVNAIAFVPEIYAEDLKIDQDVTFRLSKSQATLKGKIIEINPIRSNILPYPQLASINHGDLPVQQDKNGNLILVESYYRVVVDLNTKEHPIRIGEIGYIDAYGPWRSYLMTLIRFIQALFWHEVTF